IPAPDNNSFNNPLSFYWNISINDPEGDRFDWSIQCNGQTNDDKGDGNGTKSLELTSLDYKTTYTVWVNATDGQGSGNTTTKWYIFITKDTLPPVLGVPDPENGSTNQPLSFTWSIPIGDPEADELSWEIQCSNGQGNSESEESNGTKILDLSGLSFFTEYTVWVNATDPEGSGVYTRRWYTFTTKSNQPPIFGSPTPLNESTNNPLSFNWSISINDPEGNTFDWTIECNNGQSNSETENTNGTKTLTLTGLLYSTMYTILVNATDETGSGLWNRSWYTFTTEPGNYSPVFETPSPINGSINNPRNFNWSIYISDPEGDIFDWSIECSNGQTNSSVDATNGTKVLALSNLNNGTTYTIWVNATDIDGSAVYTRRWYIFITEGNRPPIFGSPSPSNGSINNPLSISWMIPINDPEGNLYDWMIQCSNGQESSGSSASNGTKTLSLSGLAYSTVYTVWVNATDPDGSGQYARRYYTLKTRDPGGGPPPEEPQEPSNKNPVADTSAREPYQGYVNSIILFDGSLSYDPDGSISNYFWDFGDNSNANGKTANHSYLEAGTYTITLTVTDNRTATNTDTTTCVIRELNRPPSKPTIQGNISGTKNTLYTYTAVSTDPDNDPLQYTYEWGGSISQLSGFIPSGMNYSVNHNWTIAGRYTLTVTVTDKQRESSSKITIYIDAIQTRGAGYLFDSDGDGSYDAFYSDETHKTVLIQIKGDSYLIDKDGDGQWEYVYNDTYGLTSYQEPRKTPGFELVFSLGAIAVFILLSRKRKNI
ncbi:MAG TPA: PKD domain-containing protein, partial [Candidatus Thermoplasmatota archaeon]|nr:PKD domain-containing protein [Candidatus Thermoplasmatota archaeon]